MYPTPGSYLPQFPLRRNFALQETRIEQKEDVDFSFTPFISQFWLLWLIVHVSLGISGAWQIAL